MNRSGINFQTLFESAPFQCLILFQDFSIAAVTDRYLAVTMTKRDEIIGKNIFEVFPDNPDDPGATGTSLLRASLNRVIQSKRMDSMAVQKYDIRRPASAGGGFEERYWSPTNSPVLSADGEIQYIIHQVEDVTELVKLKQEGLEQHRITEELRTRADQEEKIRQAQRMEAMGQLAGGVAHDFNNILGTIMLLCDRPPGETVDPSVQKRFDQIHTSSERAASLTRQLLAFSRKQVLLPRVLNLNAIIENLDSLLGRLLNEDIKLVTQLDPKLGNTLADTGQVEQVVLNLIVNARDALPRGGKITIETKNAKLDEALSSGALKVPPGEYIMLAVRDNGIGMSAQTQARLFEPFFTTKGVGRGTGLGLATVYGIVQQSNATIWVYSEPQRGSVFKIYFPRVDQNIESSESVFPISKVSCGRERVLVVEDQVELRSLISETLKGSGYEVHEAANGLKALDLIQNSTSKFDLVITDVVMPEMGGRELAQKLMLIDPQLKILYLSGYTEDTLSNYGVSGSLPHFLEKPFSRSSLLKKIRNILE